MSTTDSPALRPLGVDTPSSSFRLPRRVFVGSVVSPESLVKLKLINRAVIGVGASGVIRFVEDLDAVEASQSESSQQPGGTAAVSSASHLDEDRSSTPVNIPGRAADQGFLDAGIRDDDGSDLTLPPPALESHGHANGHLSAQRDKEQALLELIVGKYGWRLQECETVLLSSNSFIGPGFIDTHVHAPQVPNLGRGQQYELLDWLENITFPREKKFEDPNYAKRTYDDVVQRMLDCGTTCAAIYATLHEEATMILANICNEKGMRAFVGKCQMDRNAPVEYKEKNSSASMEATKRFISYCRNLAPYGTAKPLSPRFDPLNSTGSSEMDDSIARLSVTMNGIIDGKEDVPEAITEKQVASPENINSQSSSAASTVLSTSLSASSSNRSEASTNATSVGGEVAPELKRQLSSKGHRVSGPGSTAGSTTSSTRGVEHQHRLSRSSVSSNSGNGTPRRAPEHVNALVQPILTPRFAIACSDALLASISALLSRDATLRVQTHLSENPGEIAFTKSLFPFCETYTDVYDHFSLLTPRTILAHAIHLDEKEMTLIADRKCGISHCPTSNLNLRSGASRLGELLNRGIKVGLGTDMSGGFGMSILTAIRDASIVAKVLQFSPNGEEGAAEKAPSETKATSKLAHGHDFCKGPLPIATLFYLATLGGAEVCNVAHRVGSIEPGKEFDAILFNCDNSNPNLFVEDEDGLEEKLEKMLFCGDDRNVASVFVRGRVVGGSAPIS